MEWAIQILKDKTNKSIEYILQENWNVDNWWDMENFRQSKNIKTPLTVEGSRYKGETKLQEW